jgi:2-aminoadipate transaminase
MDTLLSRRARQSTSSVIRELLHLTERPGILSLAGGLPAPEALPLTDLDAAWARVRQREGRYGPVAFQYGPTEGLADLRALVAERFSADAATGPEEVLVTTGSQQGLDLLARALVDPGDPVVVEAPTYLGALQALSGGGPRFVTVPTDGEGMLTDVLQARLRTGLRPKCAYVVANFQNPSAATLSIERRRHLAALADHYGFVVIEDDPYGELRFRGAPVPSVRTWTELAVRLGTASKTVSPGLRVGWLAAPAWLLPALVRTKQAVDLHTSTLSQALVVELLSDTTARAAHLDRARALYRERADALRAGLAHHTDGALTPAEPDGGMFLWARLPDDAGPAETLLRTAVEHGVAFVPGTAFYADSDRGHDHIRCSFATLDPAGLDEAASRLGAALRAA